MKWSFSKLCTYAECPLAFYLSYLQDPPLPQDGNAWSDFGNLCHHLLESYALGELSLFDLAAEYTARYDDEIVHNYPPILKGYADKAYAEGLKYFEEFEGFNEEKNEIVSAEERFEIGVGPYRLVGISDLVLRNKETGGLIVVDHKTKSPSSMKHDYSLYRNQLYLYAEHVKTKYGAYPETLIFNMIKDPTASIREEFDPVQMGATLRWTEEQIDRVYLEEDWKATRAEEILSGKSDFYCRHICPVFQYCEEAQTAIQHVQARRRK